jgi:hypothetical protein
MWRGAALARATTAGEILPYRVCDRETGGSRRSRGLPRHDFLICVSDRKANTATNSA